MFSFWRRKKKVEQTHYEPITHCGHLLADGKWIFTLCKSDTGKIPSDRFDAYPVAIITYEILHNHLRKYIENPQSIAKPCVICLHKGLKEYEAERARKRNT